MCDYNLESTMNDYCQFLKKYPDRKQAICTAAINFCAVGANREICRICPLSELGTRAVCDHMDVYVYQERYRDDLAITVEVFCDHLDDVAEWSRCPACPRLKWYEITTKIAAEGLVRQHAALEPVPARIR